MNWEVLIVILIPLAVWILGSIFRGAENQEKDRPPKPPQDGGPARPQRRPKTDLDRFLEEARARRQAAPKPEPTEETPPPRPEPVVLDAIPAADPLPEKPPMPRPRERPPQDAERRPKQRPPATREQPRREPAAQASQPVRAAGPVAPPPLPPAVPVMDMRMPTQNPPGETQVAPVVTVPPTRPRSQPPAALKLIELMKDRQNMAAAFMLGEVFGPPLAQRRRKRS